VFAQFARPLPLISFLVFLPLFTWLFATRPAIAQAQDHSAMHHDHDGMSMQMDETPDPAAQAKLLRDKQESEFNHHLAGFFVVLAGIFILFESRLGNRWPSVRYAWPLCFLLSGIFVLIFSDTELWPFGPKSWWIGVTGNREVLQHKTFAFILLALGIIELRRATGSLRAAWSAWVFPALAVAGSTMLLFHAHDAGMHGSDAMTTMHRIQMQHFSYAAIGTGIGITKGLSDTSIPISWIFRYLWPLLMIGLGAILMLYAE